MVGSSNNSGSSCTNSGSSNDSGNSCTDSGISCNSFFK